MVIVLLCLILAMLPGRVTATTYYIDNAGSNANAGTSTGAPWLTWAYAFANSACGDTLIAMDGTYTHAVQGAPVLTKVCTVSTPYTVITQTNRGAFIDGDGNLNTFRVLNSQYVTIDGLHVKSADLVSGTSGGQPLEIRNSPNTTVKNCLARLNNRYKNAQVIGVYDSPNTLIEGCELYDYHRHGIQFYYSNNSVARRNYCNSRNRADIPGGDVSGGVGGDSCVTTYPSSGVIIENNINEGGVKGFSEQASNTSLGNKFLGNISIGEMIGLSLDVRDAGLSKMPQQTIVQDHIAIAPINQGIRFRGVKNAQCIRCTVIGGASLQGFLADNVSASHGDGNPSFTATNSLVTGVTGVGFLASTTYYPTWSINYSASSGNGTAYTPTASHANITNESAASPTLGTCKVWLPSGSPLIGAGLSIAGNSNIGGSILYRYENGVLTDTKLWDSVTGEFPHGALVTGVNDTAGTSAYNVHERLNVNFGGCSFPPGYGGAAPTNPVTHHMFSGTGAISGAVTVPAGLDFLGAFLVLRDAGLNVAQVTAVTLSCGSQSFTFGARGRSHVSSAVHNTEGWVRAAPASGACTVSATTTGTVTSWIMDVFEVDNSSGITGWAASGSSGVTSSTPAVTVPTNTSEIVVGATSGASACVISVGADQTALVDELLSPMRLAVSQQSGGAGGVVSYVQGCASYWAMVGVSFAPGAPDPPSGSTFRVTNYRVESLHGSVAAPEVPVMALASDNTSAKIGAAGAFRLLAEILVEVATSSETGIGLECAKNASGYVRVQNAFGSGAIRFYGAEISQTIPASLTAFTPRLTGTIPGRTLRDASSVLILPIMSSGTRMEVDFQLVVENGGVAGDYATCRIVTDAGTLLGVHTVSPIVDIVGGRAVGF